MERALILLVAALMAYMAPGVQATAHLSFANGTEVNITRDGCGTSKLCLETPASCDPAGTGDCLFVSVVSNSTAGNSSATLSIELRGDSNGYIAVGFTANPNEGTTMLFICAKDSNGTFFFRTMQRNNTNNMLNSTERRTTEIRGEVNGTVIRCEFDIPGVNITTTRNSATTGLLLGSGPVTGGVIGAFSANLTRTNLDFNNPASTGTDPSTNVVTTPAPSNNNTTMASNTTIMMTTAGSSGPVHLHAVLLLLSVISFFLMLTP